MKSELVLLGLHIGMASRARRRMLVVLLYAAFAAVLSALWFVDNWRSWTLLGSAFSIALAGLILRRLVRPFEGNNMLWRYKDPPKSRIAKLIIPKEPDIRNYRNDERELRWRDRAHYYSHRILAFTTVILCFQIFDQRERQFQNRSYLEFLMREVPLQAWTSKLVHPLLYPSRGDDLLLGVALSVVFISVTLPQSLILWFEPNFEPDA